MNIGSTLRRACFLAMMAMASLWAWTPIFAQVCKVECRDGQSTYEGTCFCIGSTSTHSYYMTAAHCVDGYSDITIDRKPASIVALEYRSGKDIAVLRQDGWVNDAYELRDTWNQGAVIYGYPLGSTKAIERSVRLSRNNMYVNAGRYECLGDVCSGDSGGPILDRDGFAVGVINAIESPRCDDTMIATINVRQWVEDHCPQVLYETQQKYDREARVVVFTFPDGQCVGCDLLKRDIARGRFAGYQFEFVTFDPILKQFDKPEIYNQFRAECSVPPGGIEVPVIWMPGSGKYRKGYGEPTGLLGWLEDVVQFIASPIFGHPPMLPTDGPIGKLYHDPLPVPEEFNAEQLKADVKKLRSDVREAFALVEDIRELDTVGKIKKLPEVIDTVGTLRKDVGSLKDSTEAVRANPLKTLFAVISGFVASLLRGFMDKKEAVAA